MSNSPSADEPILTIKSSAMTAVMAFGATIVGIAMLFGAVQGFMAGSTGQGLGLLAVGALALAFGIYEILHLGAVERYYRDRIECEHKGSIKRSLKFADGFQFSFAFQPEGDAILSIRGNNGAKFDMISSKKDSPGTSFNPSREQVEELSGMLRQIVVGQIRATLKEDKPFEIDKHWKIERKGATFNGQLVPYDALSISEDDDGDVTFLSKGQSVARKNMMDENVIPAVSFLEWAIQQSRNRR